MSDPRMAEIPGLPNMVDEEMCEFQAMVPTFDEEKGNDDMTEDIFNNSNELDGMKNEEDHIWNVSIERTDYDLEALVGTYSTNALIIRLLHIAEICPALRADALKMLIAEVMKNTQNVTAYTTAYQKVEMFKAQGQLPNAEIIPPIDNNWVENTTSKANTRLEYLNSEFRRQKDDGVKESIRRAMDDVFQHYMLMGNICEALKLYSRGIREYCTAPNYLITMLLNWINATVYAEQWAKLNVLIPQAERAVAETNERDNASASGAQQNRAQARPPAAKNLKALLNSSTAKLNAVSGLNSMRSWNFKLAADKLMAVELDCLDYQDLLSSSDIAVMGTLCALASYPRNELKERVLGSANFRKFLEAEPKLVELLQKFCANQFGAALDILQNIKNELFLNFYIAPHVNELYRLIRLRAIVQYFEPYLTLDMNVMAAEFRTDVDELQRELVDLIRGGSLNARIDAVAKVLMAKTVDCQQQVLERTLKVNKDLETTIKGIIIRSAIQQQGLFVGMDGTNRDRRRANFDDFDDRSAGSTGSRMLAHVQRIFNVGSSRVHPSASADQDVEDVDADGNDVENGRHP